MRWAPSISLGSPQGIHTWLYLVWWKTSLHSSHCREFRPSLESGHLSIHSTWCSKLRVPLTYLLLKYGFSWGACGYLAYLFNRILGIHSLLEMIWPPWSFPRVPVQKHAWCLCREIRPSFVIRASRGSFQLKLKTQDPSHIHIPKGKLLLRCLWKNGLTYSRRQGINSHLQTIWGARIFHPVALLKLMFL